MGSHLAVLAAGESSHRGHRTLAEKAFDTLHAAIITGAAAAGRRLPIEELAGALEMSPMPIREAVRRLDAAGLVREHPPPRGPGHRAVGRRPAEVYEARLALEVLAIRRAAERFRAAQAAEARKRLAIVDELGDEVSAAASEAHTRFHFAAVRGGRLGLAAAAHPPGGRRASATAWSCQRAPHHPARRRARGDARRLPGHDA